MDNLHPSHHDYLPAAGRDSLLPFYDLLARFGGAPRVYRQLLSGAGLSADQSVLEIGCGTGSLLATGTRLYPGVRFTGIDPDPLALERARRKVASATLSQAYAQDLPFEDGTFDHVLSSLMVHHLRAEEQDLALAEARRVTRPGGKIHVVDLVARRQGLSLHRTIPASIADDLPGLLRGAGFVEVHTVGTRRTRFGTVEFLTGTRHD